MISADGDCTGMLYTGSLYMLCIMWAEYTRVLIWAVYARVVLEQPTERHAKISGCGPPCIYIAILLSIFLLVKHRHDQAAYIWA